MSWARQLGELLRRKRLEDEREKPHREQLMKERDEIRQAFWDEFRKVVERNIAEYEQGIQNDKKLRVRFSFGKSGFTIHKPPQSGYGEFVTVRLSDNNSIQLLSGSEADSNDLSVDSGPYKGLGDLMGVIFHLDESGKCIQLRGKVGHVSLEEAARIVLEPLLSR